jgi:pimeloyl-ACP methyl ester carboxylesterase
VIRLPADSFGQRVGSLVINPGGPGGSGIDYARVARVAITAPVRQRFDIVGFDPRGVGESSPVDCLTDRELDEFISGDASPDDAGERREAIRASQSFARGCARRTGDLLGHVATQNVARDLDVLRAALDDERLYYLGKSYGTFIGATYAELFPKRVGRLVLDGALDPRVNSEEMALAQARGFERALTAFVGDCLQRAICPLTGDRDQALDQVRALLQHLDRSSLRTGEPRRLTQSLAVLGVVAALYEEQQGWPALAVALRLALRGDGSALLQLSDIYTERTSDGRYRGNQNEAIYAVNCLDHPAAASPVDGDQVLQRFRAASPTFGEFLAWSELPCKYWPVPPVGTARPVAAPGAPPILVVGTTRDPATPYAWAQGLATQLQSGVLLTYVGDGHTAYARGSDCVDSAVEAYLVRGRAPRDGARCA